MNLSTKKDARDFNHFFLMMLSLSHQHPSKAFSFKGYIRLTDKLTVISVSDWAAAIYPQIMNRAKREVIFTLLLNKGILERRPPHCVIDTIQTESDCYVTCTRGYLTCTQLFGFTQAFYTALEAQGITANELESMVRLYDSNDKANIRIAFQSGMPTIINVIQSFLSL